MDLKIYLEKLKKQKKFPTINIKNKPIAKIFTTSFGLLLVIFLYKF